MGEEEITIEDFEVIEDGSELEITDFSAPEPPPDDGDYGEVLELTAYNSSNVPASSSIGETGVFGVAQYDNINIQEITAASERNAKSLVRKIENFICSLSEVNLSKEHRDYVRVVADIELRGLSDLIRLVEINNTMINNIAERINTTSAEDYAIIQQYNNILNTHLKLTKEIQTYYINIPSRIKTMQNSVMDSDNEETTTIVPTHDMGTKQFASQKDLLRTLAKEIKEQKNAE